MLLKYQLIMTRSAGEGSILTMCKGVETAGEKGRSPQWPRNAKSRRKSTFSHHNNMPSLSAGC